jgi:glycosyltransferase involved in cell wall biosynthesis
MESYTGNVSILMPVKNGMKYLAKSRFNIENNLGPNDEVVVIDDNSDDGTDKYLIEWAKVQNRLHVIKLRGNGIVDALNLGLQECSNQWVARFDVDDEYESNRIAKQKNLINQKPVAIFSDYDFIDDFGNNFGSITSPVFPSPTVVSLARSVRTAHSSVLYDKYAVIESGGYLQGDFPAEDLSLWLRLSKNGDLISVPEKLLHYKLRKGSVTNMNRDSALKKRDDLIKQIGISKQHFDSCIKEFNKTLDSYSRFEDFTQRKILFFRDVLTPILVKDQKIRIKLGISSKIITNILNVDSLSELRKLRSEQIKRGNLRGNL